VLAALGGYSPPASAGSRENFSAKKRNSSMDARHWAAVWVLVLSLAPTAFGQMPRRGGASASARSQNFLVSTVDHEFAEALLKQAETSRRELAIEFFGKELPPSPQPIMLTAVDVGPRVQASGVTQFGFHGKTPHGFTMVVAGSKERILDSVLPHEVLHTVLASFFGKPVIRWADEGCCTTVEHASERKKQDKLLIEFLHTDRGIAFNHMFHMKDYPRDMLPLYSQGYSLCRYLIAQGGKQKFMQYLAKGMSREQWDAVTKEFYGYEDLSDLQVSWVEWVRSGSPDQVDSRTGDADANAIANKGVGEESLVVSAAPPPAPVMRGSEAQQAVASNPDASKASVASYYERQKELSPSKNLPKPKAGRTQEIAGKATRPINSAKPSEPQKPQQQAIEWGAGAPQRAAPVTKSLPSVRPSSYEPPNYREAVKSVSTGWTTTSGTMLR
jgi:hypothetical protein